MLAITIIVISFIAGLLGVAHSHSAKSGRRSYKGLSGLGLTLVALATLGMVVGVAKEISAIRAATLLAEQEAERDQMLKEMYAVVVGAKTSTTDTALGAQLETLADRIAAAASRSRESDYRLSDFSRSDFSGGNFTQATFRGALFREADMRGADLRTALIDEQTRLPER